MQIRTVLIAALLVCSLGASVTPADAQNGGHDPAECAFPVSESDATEKDVTIEERPERIVVLQPSAAQTVWELDAQDRVVGAPVVPYTSYLDGIDGKTNVLNADEFSVNEEAVVELDADLVLAPNVVPDDAVESLRDADQTVFKFEFGTSLDFVAEKTERTGRLIGSCGEAESVNERYWERIEAVERGTDGYDTPRVLYYADGFAAGSGTFINELITTAGGVNVAAENDIEKYGEINDEAIVDWDPDVIIVSDDGPGVPESDAFESTFAVENEQIAVLDGDYLSQPAPRIAIVLKEIAAAFAEAETAGPTESATDGTPGFGIAVALIALLSVLLLAPRSR